MEASSVLALVESFQRKRSSEAVVIDSLELKSFNEKKTMPPVWRMVLNGKPLKRENPYRISYHCPKCQVSINMNYEVFATKMNKGLPWIQTLQCKTCYESEKVEIELGKGYSSIQERVRAGEDAFRAMDSSFQWRYHLHYPTEEEFEQFRSRIVNQDELLKKNSGTRMVYCPTVQVPNARCFEPRLWFWSETGSNLETLVTVPSFRVRCDWCTNEFEVNTLHQVKLFGPGPVICHLCKKMALTPPRVESTPNAVAKGDGGLGLGLVAKKERKAVGEGEEIVKPGGEMGFGLGTPEKVEYRSHTGLKFVRGCIKRGLIAEKGPTIQYQWVRGDGVIEECCYQVAFSIPKLSLLVLEVDSQEQWSVEKGNGKWAGIIGAVEGLLKEGKLVKEGGVYQRYLVIHSKNKAAVFQKIEGYQEIERY